VIDDIALVRSVWTTDNDHRGATSIPHGGGMFFDGIFPSVGAWVHYGLGTLNENLPQFIVLGETGRKPVAGGVNATGASYLGPEACRCGNSRSIRKTRFPLRFPGSDIYQEEQKKEFGFIQQLDRLGHDQVSGRPPR